MQPIPATRVEIETPRPMTTTQRLKDLLGRATPGPLDIDHDHRPGGVDQIVETRTGRTLTVAFGTSNGNEDDLPLLAESRNSLPALLAVVEAAEGLKDEFGDREITTPLELMVSKVIGALAALNAEKGGTNGKAN